MSLKTFFTAVEAHLNESLHVEAKVGEAPEGKAQYVVIWPAPGAPVDAPAISGHYGKEAMAVAFRVTVVAPTVTGLMYTQQDVNDALIDAHINGCLVVPDVIANRSATPLQDNTLRPAPHYLVTTWHTTLTR